MTITFKRIKPRTWSGNGFGYDPATYGVYRDSKPVGVISSIGTGTWWIHALDPSEEFGKRTVGSEYKLVDAKRKAREYFA
jgi:hypothetical protein